MIKTNCSQKTLEWLHASHERNSVYCWRIRQNQNIGSESTNQGEIHVFLHWRLRVGTTSNCIKRITEKMLLYSRSHLINHFIFFLFQGILESELPIEVPVVILGNKTDKPGCYGRVELLETLEIQEDVQKVRSSNYI